MTPNPYDDWRRSRSCSGKRRYTATEAFHAAQMMHSDERYRRRYQCAYCGWWHVGRTRGFDDRDRNEWPTIEEG